MNISGTTKVIGIIGFPVGHSLSPVIQNYFMREHSINGVYIPLPVKTENLKSALGGLSSLGIKGANLTVPHKSDALLLLDKIDTIAKKIGAVNTVRVTSNNKLEGTNTDSAGFLTGLLKHSPKEWNLSNKPAVVLGAGGAARAVIYALTQMGPAEIRIVNRSFDRADRLARDLGPSCKAYKWEDRDIILKKAALLVNTTKCGMIDEPELNIDLSILPTSAVVNDIVYNPLYTALLRKAQCRGNVIIDGIEMLLNQAGHAFKYWFGINPEVTDDLRKTVRHLLLTGH